MSPRGETAAVRHPVIMQMPVSDDQPFCCSSREMKVCLYNNIRCSRQEGSGRLSSLTGIREITQIHCLADDTEQLSRWWKGCRVAWGALTVHWGPRVASLNPQAEAKKLEDAATYLSLPSTKAELEEKGHSATGKSMQSLGSCTISKDSFQVSTLVCSTKLTQNGECGADTRPLEYPARSCVQSMLWLWGGGLCRWVNKAVHGCPRQWPVWMSTDQERG